MSQTSTRILLVALSVSILLFLRSHSGGVVVDRPHAVAHEGQVLHSRRAIVEAAARDMAGAYVVDGGVLFARQDTDSTTDPPETTPPATPTATPTPPTRTPIDPTPDPDPDPTTTTKPPNTPTPDPPPTGGTTTTPPAPGTEPSNSIPEFTYTSSTSGTSPPSSSSTNPPKDNDEGGFKKSTVIGVAVAGGIALAAIIAFIAWKMTRKRLSDFDGDGSEQIKWPELNNNDTHALPARPTGRSGIDSSPPRSHADLYSDAASHTNSDVHGAAHDPYAVPPLPHMNPNQPYHDDPYGPQNGGGGGAYYDPYRGPVPAQFQGGPDAAGNGQWGMQGGEAIPMGTYNRTRSPGPAAAYGYEPSATPVPRQASPGPNMAYGGQPQRHASPAPGAAYGGYPAQGQYPQQQQGAYYPNNRAADDPYGGMS